MEMSLELQSPSKIYQLEFKKKFLQSFGIKSRVKNIIPTVFIMLFASAYRSKTWG